jgi:very-short-patch-repair endonuclease
VYSIVPVSLLKVEGRWLGAVLACGHGAVLSHTAAAALWEIRAIPSGAIHVTVPTYAGRRQRSGIMLHRSGTLLPSDTTVRDSIPVTAPCRTVADLRRTLPPTQLKAVLRRAEQQHLEIGPQPEHVGDPDRTELERRVGALCRRHSLPRPREQVVIGPYTVDFLWPERRLVLEVDGWEAHGARIAFEDDRARDAELKLLGYDVIRFTWRQVTRKGPWVAATVRRLLARKTSAV